MRDACERCGASLEHQARAYICSFECTFCPECADSLAGRCPNCGGELVARPRRVASGATGSPQALP
jgi:uncharacterized protein